MKGLTVYTLVAILFLTSFLVVPACENNLSNMAAQKSKWDELVGKTGDEAKAVILNERPDLKADRIHIMPADSMMTMDFCTDRVRILVDAAGKVASPPRIG